MGSTTAAKKKTNQEFHSHFMSGFRGTNAKFLFVENGNYLNLNQKLGWNVTNEIYKKSNKYESNFYSAFQIKNNVFL